MPFFKDERLPEGRKRSLAVFQKAAGLKFKNQRLLHVALTHRSAVAEKPDQSIPNNERLEFLGDSILGACVASWLYLELPARPEGELARIKSFVVSEACLAEIAMSLGLDALLVMGRGEELSGGRKKKALLADAFEAVLGALYLETDYPTARKFVLKHLVPEIHKVLSHQHTRDYKTIVQEFFQKHERATPRYALLGKSGPDHEKIFTVQLTANNKVFPEASGKSKKEAEQRAARLAYDAIIAEGGPKAQALLSLLESSV